MNNHLKLWISVSVLAVVAFALALRWWGPSGGGGPAQRASRAPSPVVGGAPPTSAAWVGGRGDPSSGWAASAGAPAATAAAVAFAEAFVLSPPGAPGQVVAARCAALVTPGFEARLASSPGAPVLRGLAAPVSVVSVSAVIEDWEAGGAGVDVGMSLRVGSGDAPSFLGLGIHVVAADGRPWLVDGLEL